MTDDDRPPALRHLYPRTSASADASRRAHQEDIRRMTARERMLLALSLADELDELLVVAEPDSP